MYDYKEADKNDVLEYIKDEINFEEFDSLEELEQHLNDKLWTVDSVTGNASGSYTFNRVEARENVIDNIDILWEAVGEFGTSTEDIGNDFLNEEWEKFDVTIRCYLLGECIAAALEEIEDDFNEAHEGEEDEE